jgi:hypothetical protein
MNSDLVWANGWGEDGDDVGDEESDEEYNASIMEIMNVVHEPPHPLCPTVPLPY